MLTGYEYSSAGYFSDRYDDALDIFSIQLGYGFGAKGRIGPLQTGLLMDVGLGGLRGGDFLGVKDFWPRGYDTPAKVDLVGVIVGVEGFGGSLKSNRRGKSFSANQIGPISYTVNPHAVPEWKERAKDMQRADNPWPYYSQIDLAAGVFINMRLGFNPGELLDFIMGWTTFACYNDDLSKKMIKMKKEEND
ncbi:MAG: hypothetical protein GY737_16440 [Desulfobacteraceae bacterium]|nr:hypothetical protein [Desulfobacteraceae bacterium]